MGFSFCLIGEDSLLIQTGNILLKKKHTITLVVSPIQSIQEWAILNNIPFLCKPDDILSINNYSVDYLFSIVNSHILSRSILKIAHKYAINYHDSLLPKYAGLNATSWAIMNDEQEHGVTWHVMDDEIDTGDILIQEHFYISNSDTALSLNLRCYEYAIKTFTKLIESIDTNHLDFKKQSLPSRTYYSGTQTLPNFGFIDWQNMPAKKIEQISRALTFGHYSNNVGTLKLLIDNHFLIVGQVLVVNNTNISAVSNPGKIVAIDNNTITVETVDNLIQLSNFSSIKGNMLSIAECLELFSFEIGYVFPQLTANDLALWKKWELSARKGEAYWLNSYKAINENSIFPMANNIVSSDHTKIKKGICLTSLFPHMIINNYIEIFITAILIYLSRLNNQEPVTVSLVNPEYNAIIEKECGLFVNFLPVNFSTQTDHSLNDVFNFVKNKILKKIEQNPFCFKDLTARHPVLRNTSSDLSILINTSDVKTKFSIPSHVLLYFDIDPYKGKMAIYHRNDLGQTDASIQLILHYCIEHLLNITLNLINHSQLNATNFNFLSNVERNLLMRWGSGKSVPIPNKNLGLLFEEQVHQNGDKVAIHFEDKTVTYSQLNFQANAVVGYLQSQQIQPKAIIGIYLNRGIDLIAIILGILKAGCSFLPLDTRYPMLKIQQIFEDSNLAYVFVENQFLNKFTDFFENKTDNLFFMSPDKAVSYADSKNIKTDSNYSDDILAYVMFTSGTTGRPKGVMVSHKNVVNYCMWFSSSTNFSEQSIIDFSSSIAFDLSIPCTIAPLIVGGSIAIAKQAQKANPREYLKHLQKYNITHTELTPGYLELLLNYPKDIAQLKGLSYLLLGADTVPSNDVSKWLSLCPDSVVVNEYGPTETTVSVTSYFVDKDEIKELHNVPIGKPGLNSTCYVLDKNKNLCPAGMKGELHIGGKQVALGYLNREDLTQNKFIHANFIKTEEKIYKSGDIVAWLPNGQLQFYGRNDHQVKIQGYRVELSAIESFLVKHPDIEQAAVLFMKEDSGDQFLKAYIVSTKDISVNTLKQYLLSYIPSYMVPREFCRIPYIPLKENEKIDFSALEDMKADLLKDETKLNTSNTLTDTEQTITTIWNNAFHKTLQLGDDFFDFGGDSLIAMQIMNELQNHFKMTLPLHLLFENPTIAKLSQKITKLGQENLTEILSSQKIIIQLAKGEHPIPLFLIHPVGGSIFWYQKLSSLLNGKYTIFAIQDPSIINANCRFSSFEEMAAFYVQEIEKIYKDDSFYIAGASFGATVAVEIASQLQKKGKTIKFLGLFDGWAYYPDEILQGNSLDLLLHKEKIYLDKDKLKTLNELEVYRKQLLLNYKIPSLKIHTTLFKASETWSALQSFESESNGWNSFIHAKLTIRKVPGNHESMFFLPYVKRLSLILLQELSKVDVIEITRSKLLKSLVKL